MKLLLYILACLVIAVGAGSLLKGNSGQVVFALADMSVQTSLSFFVLLVLLGFLAFYFLLRSTVKLLDLPKNYRRWRLNRGYMKSEYYLTQGNLALIEGNWSRAEKLFRKGARYSRLPMINYIGAARAAQKLGAVDRRDSYLRQAYSDNPKSEFAVGLARAELQLNQDQTEQAYATLQHIDGSKPGQDRVKLMMLEASAELNDWDRSLSLLEDLESSGVLPIEKIRSRQLQAYAEVINRAAAGGDRDELKSTWHAIPRKLRKELYLIEVYVRGCLQFQETAECERMIRQVIKYNPDPSLVRLYGLVQGENPSRQLSFMKRLMKDNPNDYNIQLTAGRLYKRAELWGKAGACFEKSLDLAPSPEAYYELATLFESRGDHDQANRYYQEGLALATRSPATEKLELHPQYVELPGSEID